MIVKRENCLVMMSLTKLEPRRIDIHTDRQNLVQRCKHTSKIEIGKKIIHLSVIINNCYIVVVVLDVLVFVVHLGEEAVFFGRVIISSI